MKVCCIVLFFSVHSSLFAEKIISSEAENLFNSFMDFRRILSLTQDDQSALKEIDDFMNQFYLPFKDNFSEEELIVINNLYTTERYNYLQYDKNGGSEQAEKELLNQLENVTAYMDKGKTADFNKWTLVTSANVIGCYMSFHPVPAALKYGQRQKDFYKEAYEQNPDFWYAVSHYAQWLFFAPSIYGGGKKKAESLFLKSLEISKTDTEKYYSNIFLSQFYFTEGKKQLSLKYLDAADSYLPGGRYVSFIRKINSEGKSTFEYKEE